MLYDSLFPEVPRVIPGKRWLSIISRTLHLLGIAGLAGAHLYQLPYSYWSPYLWLTVITGSVMLLMEVYSSGIWLVQMRGTAIMLKLALLSSLLWWFDRPEAVIYVAVILISGVISHAPGKLRYYSIWHGRLVTDRRSLRGGSVFSDIKDCGG